MHNPDTHEAVERWRQGKINVFDELAKMEDQRDRFEKALSFCVNTLKTHHISKPGIREVIEKTELLK
jgi:hypothetical protein